MIWWGITKAIRYSHCCYPIRRNTWSEEPFQFSIAGGEIIVNGLGTINIGKAGVTIKVVQQHGRKKHFPSDGNMSNSILITILQYNNCS